MDNKDKFIDLHIHTPHSDGDIPEEEIIKIAEQKKLAAISFTDHDNIKVHKKLANIKHNIPIIPGIEITSLHKGGIIEILGYGFDTKTIDKDIKHINMATSFELRYQKFLEKLKKFNINITLTKEELADEKRPDKADIVLEHVLAHPKYRNILQDINPNFVTFKKDSLDPDIKKSMGVLRRQGFYNTNSPMFLDLSELYSSADDAIDVIKSNKGKAILAHGGEYENSLFHNSMNDLGKKLDGVEIYHPANNPQMRKFLENFAEVNKKLTTGGSDFHGPKRPERTIGCEKVPAKLLDQLLDR